MLGLYYAPGACSMAAHIVLEESGEKYEPIRIDLAKGEQRSEAYLKLNPLGRVPVLRLDDGTALAENTAILPYLGKQFGLWPSDAVGEAKLLSLIGYFACTSAAPCRRTLGGKRWLGGRSCQGRQPPKAGAAGQPLQDLPPSHTRPPRSTAGTAQPGVSKPGRSTDAYHS